MVPLLQYKTAEVAARCKGLIRVNLYKDRIKNAAHLPGLPNAPQLAAALAPSYWALANIGADKSRSRPLYSVTEEQGRAAGAFLQARGPPCVHAPLLPLWVHRERAA